MADTPAPLLVYDRIDANRRNTHLLTLAFAGLMLPFVWSVSQYLVPLMVSSTGGFHAVPAQGTISTRVATLWIMIVSIVLAVAIAHVSSLYLFVLLLWRSRALPHAPRPRTG